MVYQLGQLFDTIVSPHKTLKGLIKEMRREMPDDRLSIEQCIKHVKSQWPDDKAPGVKSTPQHLKRIHSPVKQNKTRAQLTSTISKQLPDDEVVDCVKKCFSSKKL